MSQEQWTDVDHYFNGLLIPEDATLTAALQATAEADMPEINVAPNQGKLLQILALACGARRILEVGTLGGYSTIWMARALPPGGTLITLEADAQHAAVARANFERAGLTEHVEVRAGKALDLLPRLAAEGTGPFDLVFIDADKVNTAAYFEWAVKLSRRGGFIVVDNVVRRGNILDADSDEPNVQGMRRFHEALAEEPRVSATVIQTVGSKGYDGLAIALVVEDI